MAQNESKGLKKRTTLARSAACQLARNDVAHPPQPKKRIRKTSRNRIGPTNSNRQRPGFVSWTRKRQKEESDAPPEVNKR